MIFVYVHPLCGDGAKLTHVILCLIIPTLFNPDRLSIRRNNHSCSLWLRYFQFKAGHFASFSVPHQRSIYAHCVQAVKSKRDETHRLKEQERRAKGIFVMVSSRHPTRTHLHVLI